jgi:hypothetical protein
MFVVTPRQFVMKGSRSTGIACSQEKEEMRCDRENARPPVAALRSKRIGRVDCNRKGDRKVREESESVGQKRILEVATIRAWRERGSALESSPGNAMIKSQSDAIDGGRCIDRPSDFGGATERKERPEVDVTADVCTREVRESPRVRAIGID